MDYPLTFFLTAGVPLKTTTFLLVLSMIWWGISFSHYQVKLKENSAHLQHYLDTHIIESKAYQEKHWALFNNKGETWGRMQSLYIAGQEDAFHVEFTLHTEWTQNPLIIRGNLSIKAGGGGEIQQAQLFLQGNSPLINQLTPPLRLQLVPLDKDRWRLHIFWQQAYTQDIPLKSNLIFRNPVFPFNRIYTNHFKNQMDIPDKIPFRLQNKTMARILHVTDLEEERTIEGVPCKHYQIHLDKFKQWAWTFWLSREGELMELSFKNPINLRQINENASLSMEPFNLDPLITQGMGQLPLMNSSSSIQKGHSWQQFFNKKELN